MRLTSCHGNVRGGLSEARNLGAITPLARSVRSRPVACRNSRNARSELHMIGDLRLRKALGAFPDEPVDVNQSDVVQHASPAPQILKEPLHRVDVSRQRASPQRQRVLGDTRNTRSIKEVIRAARACFSTRADVRPEIAMRMPRREWRSAQTLDCCGRTVCRSAEAPHNSGRSAARLPTTVDLPRSACADRSKS